MMGAGLTYRPHQRLWVQCPDYGADLAAGPLAMHHQTQHVIGLKSQWDTQYHPPRGGRLYITYIFSYPDGAAILLSRGVPRVGDDVDGATRALHAPSCTVHFYHCGGGKPLPNTVSPM